MKVLLKAGGNVNQATTTDGVTPLYMASQNGHVDTVKVLIDAGGDINQANHQGSTPLYAASWEGDIEMVQLFLQQPNIELNTRNKYGKTALTKATEENFDAIVQLLTNAGAQ